ncbi:MAG TPA: MFS transporter [Chloroflexi bacterium]|nr:MFS transporter [Chloroflexota bacterium]
MKKTETDDQTSISWKRNLLVIWFAELIAVAGFTIVIPLLPLYVRDLGVQGERDVRIWAGIIFSAHAVTMAIFGPIWGALGDRYGRKMMVQRAMFGGAVVIGLMGLAQSVQQLALLRAVQGALTGTVTAANALVATTAPRERSGYALGALQMAIYTGASVGPLIGGVVTDTWGFRATFGITSALLFLAALGVMFFAREAFEPVKTTGKAKTSTQTKSWFQRAWRYLSPVLNSSSLLAVMGIHLLMRLGVRLLGPVLPLFIESISAPDARVASTVGMISGVNAAAAALGALGLGRLGDRVGYRSILIGSAVASLLCYAPQAFVNSPMGLIPLQAGAGIAMGGCLAALNAMLAQLSPEGQEGIVYGLDASVVSIANAIGPMTGSLFAAWISLRAPFLIASGVFGAASVITARLMHHRPSGRMDDAHKHEGQEHSDEPAGIEYDESPGSGPEGGVTWGQREKQPDLSHCSNSLLEEDDD